MAELRYDPRSPEVMADPFAHYAILREATPVQRYDGLAVPFYVVFRHQDVREAEVDLDRYTARYGAAPEYWEPGALVEDGPTHMAFRMLIQRRFTPKAMQVYAGFVERTVESLIDAMAASGGVAELHDQLAIPLPVAMTAYLLGASDLEHTELAYLADRMMFFSRGGQGPDQAHVAARVTALYDAWIEARRDQLAAAGVGDPRPEHVGAACADDIVSDLVCGFVEGRRLTRAEQHRVIQTVIRGGVETTANLITNLVWRLLEDRSRWEAVRADPDGMIPLAVEESLRFDPPGLGLWRTTARAFELHGQAIPAHAKVQMSYGSANRDPRVFSDPDQFRLDRPMSEMRQHLTFGAGPHTCIGQHLSRLEATLALKGLFRRMPNLRLAGETERIPDFSFWGRGKLPVAW